MKLMFGKNKILRHDNAVKKIILEFVLAVF